MDDQLIDKMADAIIISMVKQGALASPDSWIVKQAAIGGPGSWMAAGMQAMRNGLNPQQLAQLRSNTGRGGMIGAGIGTALGMIRGARQTAQQAGGWRNASFGQYAKNMAGQGAIGGLGGGVVGAGAGAVGTYGKNIYQGASTIHANDLKDITAGRAMQNLGNKAQNMYNMVHEGERGLQNSIARNQEIAAGAEKNQGFLDKHLGWLFGKSKNTKTLENAQGEINGAKNALNKLQNRAFYTAGKYQGNYDKESTKLRQYIKNRGDVGNMTTLPSTYFQDIMTGTQKNINALGKNGVGIERPDGTITRAMTVPVRTVVKQRN
jgi:hypothetical protein